jgi:hypothetical protein
MVEFLDTNAISSEISKMISESKEKLYLVSPYLQMSDKLKILIQQAEKASPKIDIKVLYRSGKDSEINDKDMDFFIKQLNNANIYELDNLHAKCYLNDHSRHHIDELVSTLPRKQLGNGNKNREINRSCYL